MDKKDSLDETASSESRVLLDVRTVSKAFKGVQALDRVNLAIERGEIHSLVGENGSGKSTLIKIIAGVTRPDAGSIEFDGKKYAPGHAAIDSIRAGIQVIYQDLSLIPNITVAENIALTQIVESKQKLIDWGEIRRVAARELASIHARIDLGAFVENLSVASRQLVAIARALTQGAKLIIMDEPTTALSKAEVDTLVTIINGLRERDISTLFVSHKLEEVLEVSQRVTVIRDGRLIGVFPTRQLSVEQLETHMTGRQVEKKRFQASADRRGVPLCELRGLTRKGHFSDVSLKIWKGDILGITGLLGSGRTELALSIFGMNPPDSGEILINGEPVNIRSTEDAVRLKISYLPEDRVLQGLFESKSIADNIIVTVLKRLLGRLPLVSSRKARELVERWVEDLKIKTSSSALAVSSLSGGNQQKVVVSKWLAIEPHLFILDNPTVGIDVASKAYIHGFMAELARKGMGIVIITDEIQEAIRNCSRILVMKEGRIARELQSSEASEDELYAIVSGNSEEHRLA